MTAAAPIILAAGKSAAHTVSEALTADLAVVRFPAGSKKHPLDIELHLNPAALGVAAVGAGLTIWLLQMKVNPIERFYPVTREFTVDLPLNYNTDHWETYLPDDWAFTQDQISAAVTNKLPDWYYGVPIQAAAKFGVWLAKIWNYPVGEGPNKPTQSGSNWAIYPLYGPKLNQDMWDAALNSYQVQLAAYNQNPAAFNYSPPAPPVQDDTYFTVEILAYRLHAHGYQFKTTREWSIMKRDGFTIGALP